VPRAGKDARGEIPERGQEDMNKQSAMALGGLALALTGGAAQASCGSAFCVLNTNWATQGVGHEAGSSRLDLHFEYIDQKHLHSGTKKIAPEDVTEDILEQRTINRNWLATYDYAFTKNWSVSASLPVVSRSHSHTEDPTGAAGGPTFEKWDFNKAGDARVLGYYQFDNEKDPLVSYGLTFGLKLPTGSYKVANADGDFAERMLQPGTGSTDAVVGGYYSAPGWFSQLLYQQAVSTKDEYKPGSQLQVNVGYRYPFAGDWQALLQLNGMIKGKDSGANSEPDLSGSRTLFISPGLAYSLTQDFQLYGFVQLPLYRFYNGAQLAVDWAVVGGVTLRF
jgi:outer membrane putative beta-barrel porin/alpha-amylase